VRAEFGRIVGNAEAAARRPWRRPSAPSRHINRPELGDELRFRRFARRHPFLLLAPFFSGDGQMATIISAILNSWLAST